MVSVGLTHTDTIGITIKIFTQFTMQYCYSHKLYLFVDIFYLYTIYIFHTSTESYFPSGLNLILVGESKSRLVLKYLCSFSNRSFAVHRRMERSACGGGG